MTESSHQKPERQKRKLPLPILIGTGLLTFTVFGSYALDSVRQSISPAINVPADGFDSSSKSTVTTVSSFSSDQQRLRETAAADDIDFINRIRDHRRRIADLKPAPRSMPSVVERYSERQKQIRDDLHRAIQDDPDAVVPEDYLQKLDLQFADGPMTF